MISYADLAHLRSVADWLDSQGLLALADSVDTLIAEASGEGIGALAIVSDDGQMLLKKNGPDYGIIEATVGDFPTDSLTPPLPFATRSLQKLLDVAANVGLKRNYPRTVMTPVFSAKEKYILHVIHVSKDIKDEMAQKLPTNWEWKQVSLAAIETSLSQTAKKLLEEHSYLTDLATGGKPEADAHSYRDYKSDSPQEARQAWVKKPPSPEVAGTMEKLSEGNPAAVKLTIEEADRLKSYIVRNGKVDFTPHCVGQAAKAGMDPRLISIAVFKSKTVGAQFDQRYQEYIYESHWLSDIPNPEGLDTPADKAVYKLAYKFPTKDSLRVMTVVPRSGSGRNPQQVQDAERAKWQHHHDNHKSLWSKMPTAISPSAILSNHEYARLVSENEKNERNREMKRTRSAMALRFVKSAVA